MEIVYLRMPYKGTGCKCAANWTPLRLLGGVIRLIISYNEAAIVGFAV
jgi:hypothetical protein